ncbi:MAG: hypothetical protein P8X55_20025, partial [Desulfosarcinaceae bacterium]
AAYSSAPWFTGLTPVDYLNMTGALSSGHVEGANSLTHVQPEAANLPDLCVAVLRKISLKHARTSMGSWGRATDEASLSIIDNRIRKLSAKPEKKQKT